MTETARVQRNIDRIAECWPPFGLHVRAVLTAVEAGGFRPRLQDAARSPADQRDAKRRGVSKLSWGFHNVVGVNGKKEALAVDLVDDDHPKDEPSRAFYLTVSHYAQKHRLTTGLDWGLPRHLAEAVWKAARELDFTFAGKRGFDPLHLQPAHFTVHQARRGERPT